MRNVKNDNLFGIAIGAADEMSLDGVRTECRMLLDSLGANTLMVHAENGFLPIASDPDGEMHMVVHGPIKMNLSSEDTYKRRNGIRRSLDVINSCNASDDVMTLILHPGSSDSCDNLLFSLDELLPRARVPLALENMPGKGKQLLSDLNEMALLRDEFRGITFCIDTAHMWDAGYRLDTADGFKQIVDQAVGWDRVSCIHLNDSWGGCGRHADKHAVIGFGQIPCNVLQGIAIDPDLAHIPKIIEHPANTGLTDYADAVDRLWYRRDVH